MDKPEKPKKPEASKYGLTKQEYSKFLNTSTIFTPWIKWHDEIGTGEIALFSILICLALSLFIGNFENILVHIFFLTIVFASILEISFYIINKIERWIFKIINPNLEQSEKYRSDLSSYETRLEIYEIEKLKYLKFVENKQKEEKEAEDRIQRRKEFSYWFNLDPYEFEREIAELFVKHQFRAEPTKGSGDEGIDILLEFGNGYKGIAQCKRQKTKVSPSVIRDIYGTMMSGKFKYAFVICPAGFSEKSFEFAKGKKIILIGQKRLMQMVNDKPYSLDFLEV
jgi:HJR/Mrr/RecB family endonuclease